MKLFAFKETRRPRKF